MIWWLSMAFPHGKLSSSAWFSGICLAMSRVFIDDLAGECHHTCFVRKRRPFKISFLQLGELGQWPPWGVFFIPTTMVISPDLLVELPLLLAVYKEHQRWLYVNFWFKVDVLKDSFQWDDSPNWHENIFLRSLKQRSVFFELSSLGSKPSVTGKEHGVPR